MKTFKACLLALILTATVCSTAPLQACPMCKVANEDTQDPAAEARPRAYMYSILFMLAMPASLFTAFSVSLYRLSLKRDAMNAELLGESTEL